MAGRRALLLQAAVAEQGFAEAALADGAVADGHDNGRHVAGDLDHREQRPFRCVDRGAERVDAGFVMHLQHMGEAGGAGGLAPRLAEPGRGIRNAQLLPRQPHDCPDHG